MSVNTLYFSMLTLWCTCVSDISIDLPVSVTTLYFSFLVAFFLLAGHHTVLPHVDTVMYVCVRHQYRPAGVSPHGDVRVCQTSV